MWHAAKYRTSTAEARLKEINKKPCRTQKKKYEDFVFGIDVGNFPPKHRRWKESCMTLDWSVCPSYPDTVCCRKTVKNSYARGLGRWGECFTPESAIHLASWPSNWSWKHEHIEKEQLVQKEMGSQYTVIYYRPLLQWTTLQTKGKSRNVKIYREYNAQKDKSDHKYYRSYN